MAEDQLKAAQVQLDIQSPFLNYRAKGNQVELQGAQNIEGEDNYRLKLTYNNGTPVTYYIHAMNYRFTKSSSKRPVTGGEMDVEATYANYKQTPDGYWFAYTIVNEQSETNFDTIETNIAIDESISR